VQNKPNFRRAGRLGPGPIVSNKANFRRREQPGARLYKQTQFPRLRIGDWDRGGDGTPAPARRLGPARAGCTNKPNLPIGTPDRRGPAKSRAQPSPTAIASNKANSAGALWSASILLEMSYKALDLIRASAKQSQFPNCGLRIEHCVAAGHLPGRLPPRARRTRCTNKANSRGRPREGSGSRNPMPATAAVGRQTQLACSFVGLPVT
jgi:hypothetical protein